MRETARETQNAEYFEELEEVREPEEAERLRVLN